MKVEALIHEERCVAVGHWANADGVVFVTSHPSSPTRTTLGAIVAAIYFMGIKYHGGLWVRLVAFGERKDGDVEDEDKGQVRRRECAVNCLKRLCGNISLKCSVMDNNIQ